MAAHIAGALNRVVQGIRGPWMAFAHSCPDDLRFWHHQTAQFSAWYRTVAFDLPGFGHSPDALAGMTIPDVAAACWEGIDALTDEKLILQGNSYGGEVVLRMVEQRPERVLALVISSCGYTPGREFAHGWARQYGERDIAVRREQLTGHFSPALRETPMARHYVDMICETNRGNAASIVNTYRALGEPVPESVYATIRVPTLVIQSDGGRNPAGGIRLSQKIPGAELAMIAGAGHHSNLEQPWEFNRLVFDFLARHGLHNRVGIRRESTRLPVKYAS